MNVGLPGNINRLIDCEPGPGTPPTRGKKLVLKEQNQKKTNNISCTLLSFYKFPIKKCRWREN